MNVWKDGQMNRWMEGWAGRWTNGWRDGQADGQMGGQTAVEPGNEVGEQRREREECKLRSRRKSVKEEVSIDLCLGGGAKSSHQHLYRDYWRMRNTGPLRKNSQGRGHFLPCSQLAGNLAQGFDPSRIKSCLL